MKTYRLNGVIADFEYHSDFFDVCSPKGLKKFLDSLADGERAEIEINSPGGYVVYGVEMANAIKNSKAHIVAHVVGMAASMASVIACACDEIVMEEASFMMIHDPWGSTEGNAEEMRKEAKLLDQMKEVCMGFYLGKFSRTKEELAALMSDETWYTGNECLENGLACTVVKSDLKAAACVAEQHFKSIPKAALAFLKVAPLTAEQQAELDKAKAEQTAAPSAPLAEAPALPAVGSVPDAEASGSWEARYKGASKKINELQASLATAAEATATLQGQLDQSQKALAAKEAEMAGLRSANEQLKAKVDESAAALEAKDKDLAQARDSLAKAESEVTRLKDARQLLTAGVLTPSDAKPLHGKALIRSKN